MRLSVILFLVIVVFSGCNKDVPAVVPDPVDNPKPATVSCTFKAQLKGQTLVPVNKYYQLSPKEQFSISKLNYYISNVKFIRADGTYFTENESYHLIKHVGGLESFTITGVPPGSYTGIEFMIGVDSLRNVSGAQTGALDPSNDMFWDWNTGYIFFKLEGRYGTASIEDAEYSIHVGGFEAPYSCIQTTQVNFPATFNVQDNGNHQIDFDVKVDEIFSNPKDISIEYYYSQVTSGPKIFQDISLNYKDMFSVRNTK